MSAGATVFFGLWLQKPMRIAAANPSGRRFADALARCVDLDRPGVVLELGAGTGSLTRGLVRAGCPPDRIIAVEGEPRLAAVLRSEFPRMRVIEGDATRIDEYFAGCGERLAAVVSSLPITSGFDRKRSGPSSSRVSSFWDRAGIFCKRPTRSPRPCKWNRWGLPAERFHPGTRGCKADFLRYNDADAIYLVGDIIDGWRPEAIMVLAANPQRRYPRELCRCHAERFSWQTSIEQFLSQVVPVGNPWGNHFHAERARYAGLV